jgi:hypothetical protein
MNWIPEPAVQFWANQTMPNLGAAPAAQFLGLRINLANWAARGWLQPPLPQLPGGPISSPPNIIWCFRNGFWLAGVALTASWGEMWRTRGTILAAGLPVVQNAVALAWNDIIASAPQLQDRTINNAWNRLAAGGANGLTWTSVMTSKTLHFMVRAQGIDDDCPVPMDNAISRNVLWNGFKARVRFLRNQGIVGQNLPPIRHDGDFQAYNRYMTAILIWRDRINGVPGAAPAPGPARLPGPMWTTTDVEAAIFALARPPIPWL